MEIMNWNIRGINSEKKWLAIARKIDECGCDIICIQETTREDFDIQFIRKFAPKRFNKFEFLPSIGASVGLLFSRMALCSKEILNFKMNFHFL
jgi:exonuclease III